MSTYTFVATVGALLLGSAFAASRDDDIFRRLEGRWDLVSNAGFCKTGTDIHVIRFSKDRRIAYFERPNPPIGDDGKPVRSYSYTVIYSGAHSITMHLIGEKRQLKTGDDYIWVMDERGLDVYAWRLYGFPLRSPEPTTFRKCT